MPPQSLPIDVTDSIAEAFGFQDGEGVAARKEGHDEIVGDAQTQSDAELMIVVHENSLGWMQRQGFEETTVKRAIAEFDVFNGHPLIVPNAVAVAVEFCNIDVHATGKGLCIKDAKIRYAFDTVGLEFAIVES